MQSYGDAANNEIYLDTAKLTSLKVALKDVASFLESQGFFAAVYTEDKVHQHAKPLTAQFAVNAFGTEDHFREMRPAEVSGVDEQEQSAVPNPRC